MPAGPSISRNGTGQVVPAYAKAYCPPMQPTPNAVPILKTPRLRLRAHRAGDLADCAAMWAQADVTRFTIGRASTEQQSWARMLSYAGLWQLLGYGYWAIEERASGAFAGDAGFADFKRDVTPTMLDAPELGFALAPAFHGKGYATEAVTAALAWADAHLPGATVCMVNPQNAASLRVVEKCGYAVFERGRYNEQTVLFLSRGAR